MGWFLTALGIVLNLFGIGYSASQEKAAAYENARIAEEQAAKEREAAVREEAGYRRRARRFMSTQRALFATSGVRLDEGSPLDVMMDSVSELELDALAIRAGGVARSEYFLNQAEADRRAGDRAVTTGYLNIGRSLLTGYGKYRDWGSDKKTPRIGR